MTPSHADQMWHGQARDLDQMGELTSIGAGHAASAFSQLVGRTIEMRPPIIHLDPAWPSADPEGWSCGALFELEGCFGSLIAILFREGVRDGIVREMLGQPTEPLARESIEAVIMELGNILVSRVASAIADTLGARIIPSIPVLAMEDASTQLMTLCEEWNAHPAVRIECEFVDRHGELGGTLVLIPEKESPRRDE